MKKISAFESCDTYHIEDLIDIPSFTEILEGFNQVTGIPNSLIGQAGEPLIRAGWTDACTFFHRQNEASNQYCNKSDRRLFKQAAQQGFSVSLCANGLYDYAMPILIEGHSIATLCMGQLLHEAPDLQRFAQQADTYQFDKAAYIAAIQKIPVVPIERVEKQLKHMVQVITVLANSALSSMREKNLQQALQQSKEQRIEVTDLLDNSPIGISWCDEQGRIEYVNHTFVRMFGYTLEDLPSTRAWHQKVYPDPEYRRAYESNWKHWLQTQTNTNDDNNSYTVESAVHCKDGSIKRISAQVSLVNNKHLYNCIDITEKWRSEQRNITQNKMLRRVTQGEELNDIMYQLITDIELDAPSNLCSILLLDAEGKHLQSCAAPSLPAFYSDAINGIEIGEGVGSCGTATFLGKRVIVEDISTHRYWAPYRELTSRAGLGSCWSEPIISSTGKVLGSFAIYHTVPSTPDDDDIERISFAANLAALAIENRYNHEELSRRELAYRSLAENAPDAIARYDQHANLIYTNPNFDTLFAFTNPTTDTHSLEKYHAVIRRVIGNGVPEQVEIKIPTGSRQHYLMFSVVAEAHEVGTGALAIGRDITLHREMEQKLEKQARSDFLTQLINRRHFFELANHELTIARRYHNQLSLIMFDLDYFKQVNDTYGHAIGDLVLQKVADISQNTVRETDILARLGGEEFIVLLTQTNLDAAGQTAERLRLAIESLSIALDGEITISVTASFGVTSVNFQSGHHESHTINHIISDADSAMYSAKQKGRNRVEFA